MSSAENRLPELLRLVSAKLDGEATDEQLSQLETLVCSDAALGRAYLNLIDQEVCLRRVLAGRDRSGTTPTAALQSLPRLTRLRSAVIGTFVALAASLLLAAWLSRPSPEVGDGRDASLPLATLTQSLGCVWSGPVEFATGASLGPGRVELLSGLAEITFAGGVLVLLEGPAELELLGPMRGFLHQGSVVARVPPGIRGFVLETPGNQLFDEGTEFGVSVSEAQRTLVQVYDGEVITRPKTQPPGADAARHVTARQTLELLADGTAVGAAPAFSENRFVRLLPTAPSKFRYLPPYNRSRVDQIEIVPAPGIVDIDGTTTDWDRSGTFHGECDPPYDRDYYVDGAMMHDERFLYVTAHVGDPFPMRNTFAPDESPDVAWKGGALRVRLSTNPQWDYPLPEKRRLTAEDYQSDQFVHLLFWYHRPSERPCLMLVYGFDLHGQTATAKGWQGAFRADADGRGYTLEYAIPWSLLHVERPQTLAGRTLAASWQLSWSDAEGKVWQGHLIECTRPGVPGHPRSNAAQWGRAVYRADGR